MAVRWRLGTRGGITGSTMRWVVRQVVTGRPAAAVCRVAGEITGTAVARRVAVCRPRALTGGARAAVIDVGIDVGAGPPNFRTAPGLRTRRRCLTTQDSDFLLEIARQIVVLPAGEIADVDGWQAVGRYVAARPAHVYDVRDIFLGRVPDCVINDRRIVVPELGVRTWDEVCQIALRRTSVQIPFPDNDIVGSRVRE